MNKTRPPGFFLFSSGFPSRLFSVPLKTFNEHYVIFFFSTILTAYSTQFGFILMKEFIIHYNTAVLLCGGGRLLMDYIFTLTGEDVPRHREGPNSG